MDPTEINHYYDNCLEDYQLVWGANKHYSMHMGLHDQPKLSHHDAVINLIHKVSSLANIAASDRILDAGCGIGGSAIWIARNLGAHVTGLNINPAHIEIADSYARSLGLNKCVNFVLRDYCQTSLPSESFDVIYAIESLCYTKAKTIFFQEAHRLLKPGGRLVVADFFWHRDGNSRKEKRRMSEFMEGWVMARLSFPREFLDSLQETGFRECQDLNLTPHVLPSFRRLWRVAFLSLPFEILGKIFKFRKAIHYRNTIAAINSLFLARRRILEYHIFVSIK